MKSLFLFFLFFLSSAYAAEKAPPKLFGYTQYTKYEAPRYRAYALGGYLNYKYSPRLQPSLGVTGATREYNGSSDKVQETNYTLGVASVINPVLYVEADVSASPDAKIGAKEAYNVTPHWVVGASDFGLRFGYNRYIDSKAGLLVPSVYHDFSDRFSGYAAIYIVRTDAYLVSEQLKLSYGPLARHRFAISGGAGRALEDAGIDAEFKSLGFEYNYHFGYFTLGLAQNNYWSNLRSEKSYTLSLGFK